MLNPILQTAALLGSGTAGAIAARSLRIPAATGSLIAAAVLVWGRQLLSSGAARADLSFLLLMTLAFVGLLAGASIDLPHLARHVRMMTSGFVLRAVAVFGSVWLIGTGLGMDPRSASVLGAATTALSPAAVAAVATQTRARGALTQQLLFSAPASLTLALAATALLVAPSRAPLLLGGILSTGAIAGLLVVVPLSRMARRGSILAAAGGASALLAGVSTHMGASTVSVMLASILAGFMAGNLIPTRAIVRDALGDFGTPAAIALFALSAPILAAPRPAALLVAALLVAGGRLAGLMLPGIVARRGAMGIAGAAARLPMTGMLAATGVALAPPGGPALDPRLPGILLLAGFLCEAAGMAMTRWALVASGEAATRGDPDAWRATMR